jgi:hypothetical protein
MADTKGKQVSMVIISLAIKKANGLPVHGW